MMYLCEMCHVRVRRIKHPKFINITQTPSTHHFCSLVCKFLWIDYVRYTGEIPKAYIEIIANREVRERT